MVSVCCHVEKMGKIAGPIYGNRTLCAIVQAVGLLVVDPAAVEIFVALFEQLYFTGWGYPYDEQRKYRQFFFIQQ